MTSDIPGQSSLIRRLRMRHLELLQIMSTATTVGGAAMQMSLSQPAVTRMLKEIEDMFGGPLFNRNARGIMPNRLGLMLINRAIVLVEEIHATEQELNLARGGTGGLLRVGTFSGGVTISLALSELAKQQPDLLVTIHEGQINQLIDQLLRGELDCVIGSLPPDELRNERIDQLRMERLAEDTVAVVASCDSTWDKKSNIEWADLQNGRWALPPRDSLLRRAFVRTYLELGIAPPSPAVEALSSMTIRSLVALGTVELGLMRAEHAKEEARLGVLKIIAVKPPSMLPPLIVLSRRRPRSRLDIIERFTKILRGLSSHKMRTKH